MSLRPKHIITSPTDQNDDFKLARVQTWDTTS